jgi:hypothetical protein
VHGATPPFSDPQLKVEAVPFNKALDRRPTLIQNITSQRMGYQYFRSWFEGLWFDAMANASETEVAERWREPRMKLLGRRKLIKGDASAKLVSKKKQ